MESNVSDVVVGLMMAVFGLIGLFLVAGAADDEMYRIRSRLERVRSSVLILALSGAITTGATQRGPRCGKPPMSDAVLAARPVIYNDAVVKKFVIAAMFWGIVAFLVGVYIAAELAWPSLNLGLSFTNFGRLRPVHTSAAIFAFGGSALFGTSFYVVQRTCRARLFGGEALANFVFWGYQFFIVMAALSAT